MELPSYIAMSYLTAQRRALDVTANNLANSGTSGFKTERVLFSDWLERQNGVDTPPGGKPVSFTQDRATYRDQAAGPLTHTSNPLDLAIAGDGYFTVETARGPRLTRAGRFTQQTDGTISDSQGNALLDAAGQRLRLGPADLNVTITADGAIRSENGPIGRVGVVQPDDAMRMTAEGGTLLRADGATAPVNRPQVIQGAVEDSNVQPVMEMTRMMAGLRSFQFASQFVEAEGQRMQTTIDKITQRKV